MDRVVRTNETQSWEVGKEEASAGTLLAKRASPARDEEIPSRGRETNVRLARSNEIQGGDEVEEEASAGTLLAMRASPARDEEVAKDGIAGTLLAKRASPARAAEAAKAARTPMALMVNGPNDTLGISRHFGLHNEGDLHTRMAHLEVTMQRVIEEQATQRQNRPKVYWLLKFFQADPREFKKRVKQVMDDQKLSDIMAWCDDITPPIRIGLRRAEYRTELQKLIRTINNNENIIRVVEQDTSAVKIQQLQFTRFKQELANHVDERDLVGLLPSQLKVQDGSDSWGIYWQPLLTTLCTMQYNHRTFASIFEVDIKACTAIGLSKELIGGMLTMIDQLYPITVRFLEGQYVPLKARGRAYLGHETNPKQDGRGGTTVVPFRRPLYRRSEMQFGQPWTIGKGGTAGRGKGSGRTGSARRGPR